MLASDEALLAGRMESEWILSDQDGHTVLVNLYCCLLALRLSLGKEETLDSPASFVTAIFMEK